MADFETAVVYIDLDSLLDTRMGTIYRHGIDAVEKAVAGGYYGRLYDEFDGISAVDYKEAYAKRDLSTLKNSMLTTAAELVTQFAKKTLVALVASPLRRQPKVFINTWPYVLDEEAASLIVQGMVSVTKNLLDVEIGYITPEQLTPAYVKSSYLQMIMYSYWEWLEIHAANGNFGQTQCPQVTLIGPAIVQSKEAAKLLEGQNVFSALEAYTSLFIRLQLLPINIYCVDLIRLKEKTKSE